MGQLEINAVAKEFIPSLAIEKAEVLFNELERKERSQLLYRAMLLGNSYKNKVKIVFQTLSGPTAVETTIWATTDNNVILKGGIFIPICCILKVVF
jgi:hypothetical protein